MVLSYHDWSQVPRGYLSVEEAAKRLNISTNWVTNKCRTGMLLVFRSSHLKMYFLSPEAMDILWGMRVRYCCHCDGEIPLSRDPESKYCSNKCSMDARQMSQRRRYRLSSGSRVVLRGWYKQVHERLSRRRKPKVEEWVTFSEAVAISGLSKSQVYGLWRRGSLRTQENDNSTQLRRGGKPERLYAASELRIAGEVYRMEARRKVAA